MKIFGKKVLVIDCSWEIEDDTKIRTKLESLSDQELSILDLLKKIKVIIFDMDGVLRIGNNIIDGAQNIIPDLKNKSPGNLPNPIFFKKG